MKPKFLPIALFFSFLPFLTNAQNHCENMNIGCSEQHTSVIFDQSFTPEDPIIVKVIPSPTVFTCELTFDGQYLWVGSALDSLLYKISPIDGSVISSIKTVVEAPYGLAFDGSYLWVADEISKKIYKIQRSNGNAVFSFDAPFQGFVGGLAFDGENLWHVDADADSIYVISTAGEVLSSRNIDLPTPIALTFAGPDLWIGDNEVHDIFRLDTTTWVFLDTLNSPKWFPNGLAFDGQYLWLAENMNSSGQDSIFQIDIGLPPVSTRQVFDESIVAVFPNPTSNTFQIKIKADNETYFSKISITALDGQLVFHVNLDDQYLNTYEISLENHSPGIYFCQIIVDDQVIVKKLVKQ